MDLVGAWLRQLLRAGTAAALVPVALLGALLVIAVGSGGLGGFDSLGQLVAGPAVPEMDADGPSATENPHVAPVAPGGRDVATGRAPPASRAGASAGAAAPAPAASAPQQRSGQRIAPAPGSSSAVAPPAPVASPLESVTSPALEPTPPPAQQRPPQLGEVVGATVNNVVIGAQTLLDNLSRALVVKPPR